jgi:hypothetical protein
MLYINFINIFKLISDFCKVGMTLVIYKGVMKHMTGTKFETEGGGEYV